LVSRMNIVCLFFSGQAVIATILFPIAQNECG